MQNLWIHLKKNLPIVVLSVLLAIAVWVAALTATDPTEERRFTNGVTIELIGLNSDMVVRNTLPEQVTLNLRAPTSIWRKITNERIPAKAKIDVSSLPDGEYEIPIKIQVGISPVLVTTFSPQSAKIILETAGRQEFPIVTVEKGDIPKAFRAEEAVLTNSTVTVSGAISLLNQVDRIQVVIDHTNRAESIDKELPLTAVDVNGNVIPDLVILPEKIGVKQTISLRGGYRVVAVKVVTYGQMANGYRVTEIDVEPSFLTIYSSDRTLLDSLPGYLETEQINLSEITADISKKVGLILPEKVTLVGDQSVTVRVETEMIEGTHTLSNIPVYIFGIEDAYDITISPEYVDVFLTGPLPILENIQPQDLFAILELQDYGEGNYQLIPRVEIASADGVTIQSIQPGTIDIIIISKTVR